MSDHSDHSDHPEAPSLGHDLKRLLARRRTLALLAGAGAGGVLAAVSAHARAGPAGGCVVAADETNGPFPADGSNGAEGSDDILDVLTQSGIVRSDITRSFGARFGEARGVPLRLRLTVEADCAPAAGYAVYVWHCTPDGRYSLYDETGQNYLRGVQVSDARGEVAFTTIVPGCYAGRMTHIHVEVYGSLAEATGADRSLKVTQLTFPVAVLEEVYATTPGYGDSTANLAEVGRDGDMVFGDITAAQLAAATVSMSGGVPAGFTAVATVAV